MLVTSRPAVRAVSRAGMASTSTIWWTKMPDQRPRPHPSPARRHRRRSGRQAGRAAWSRCPYRDITRAWHPVAGWAGASPAAPLACWQRPSYWPACTTVRDPGLTPDPTDRRPERAAAELAAGLSQEGPVAVEFVGATGPEVNALYQPLVAGMGPRQPAGDRCGAVDPAGRFGHRDAERRLDLSGVSQTVVVRQRGAAGRGGGAAGRRAGNPPSCSPQLDGSQRLTQHRLDPQAGRAAR